MPRPQVTLAFAQSLDSRLAAPDGCPLRLSGPAALRYTHALRAAHDAILVGLGTVMADDPRLTVRHSPGQHPQPVLVDSQLRCPRTAQLLRHPTHRLWIFTTPTAPAAAQPALEAQGAQVWRIAANAVGQVDLRALLEKLHELGRRRVMVEGGPTLITAFLRAELAESLSLTLAPRFVGGPVGLALPTGVALRQVRYQVLEENVILEAQLSYEKVAPV